LITTTYNERENLSELIDRIQKTLQYLEYELIIVDDNSPDETWKVAEEYSKRTSNIRLIRRPSKMGLSSAFLDGLNASKGDLVGLIDSDLQHPPEVLLRMIESINLGNDLVVASRYIQGGGVRDWPFVRRIISKSAVILVDVFFHQLSRVKDPLSGYFIVKKSSLSDASLFAGSFKILLEILLKGNFASISEVPYIFESRKHGKSKLGFGEISDFLNHLYKLDKESRKPH